MPRARKRYMGLWLVTETLAFLVAGFIAVGIWITASSALAQQDHVFDLAIKDRELPEEMRVVRVTKGDAVELRWTSDEGAELHLHGYDIERNVEPGREPTVMKFVATIPGRFPVEAHRHQHSGGSGLEGDGALLYLEVYP